MSRKKVNQDERDRDVELALKLHDKFNPLGITENAVYPDPDAYDKYKPRTLIDQTLEIIDPTPNIYTLFSQFDARFFSNRLVSVEVKWSSRMTTCAGICTFHPRNRDCVISLSAPLLKLRPRKDLVETLLHEMIHGYLFLTNNNRDRDGHGPEFQKIMNKINQEAGTHITIYHSFHEEVKLYQQHWWRCDGPCQTWPPYFGMVRRAMNRAPGPSDFWWSTHQQKCYGRFIKVREPEKKVSRGEGHGINENKKPAEKSGRPNKQLDDWFTKIGGQAVRGGSSPIISSSSKASGLLNSYPANVDKPLADGFVKLGTNTNKVHGWGTGGPGASATVSSGSSNRMKTNNDRPAGTLKFSGTLGGSGTGKSKLLDEYILIDRNQFRKQRVSPIRTVDNSPPAKKSKIGNSGSHPPVSNSDRNREFYDCPVCNVAIEANLLNDHLDVCLTKESTPSNPISGVKTISDNPKPNGRTRKLLTTTPLNRPTDLFSPGGSPNDQTGDTCFCPVCGQPPSVIDLFGHFGECSTSWQRNETNPSKRAVSKPRTSAKNVTEVKASHNESYACLVCNSKISGDIALNDHLEECVQAIFNDDTFDVGNDSIVEVSSPETIVLNETEPEYPCPVCMFLIEERFMNNHLDRCLASQK